MNGGDVLASGRAKSAQFTVSEKISQERWDSIFGAPEKKSGKHFKNGEAPAGTPAELIDPPAKKKPLKKVWSR